MALWYYGWEFTQTDPTFPSYVLSSVQWIHPSLSRFIPENKLLASVPCFQKIRLLFTNDLYFLTITCRPSRSFFLFTFCFILYTFTKLYTRGPLWGKSFFIHLWQTSFVHTFRTLLFTSHGLYTNPIYIQRFFIFPNTHLWFTQKFLHIHSLLTHTRIPFHASFTHKNPSIDIFLDHFGVSTMEPFDV